MPHTKEALEARGEAIEAEVDRLDREIAGRIADGDADEAVVGRLRTKRRELLDEHGDLGGAQALISEREAEVVRVEHESARLKALAQARQDADRFLGAASKVDAALAALEDAHGQLRIASLDLSRALRLSGNADAGRLGYSMGPAMRWAIWAAAPGVSEDLQVPRATGARRRPLRESVERLIPALED